ncbi:MAG: serine/threonine-protein kinase, partial [Bacteroidota bacterium]
MTPDPTRWTRVEALFEEALGLPAPDREAFVDREAGGDAALADEVRALLDADAEAGAYFADVARSLSGTAPLAEGDRVGPYRITGRLGEGGMGTVYRAERADGAFEREVALKVLRDARGGDVRRFLAERQILARLDHPAIGRLYDGGIDDRGHPFLAMELVEGEPITAYCDRHRLGVEARLGLFRQVCEAVQFAHGRLVVHRDLKPSNVLVASGDSGEGASGKGQGGNAPSPFSLPSSPSVKLLDFGVAKLLDTDIELTQTGAAPHTPAYAAPEQVRGEEVTTATDVYALGVLLYELLTGTRPYRLTNRRREAVQQAILHAEPTQPSTAVLTPTSEADPAGTAAARATEPTRLRRRLQGDLDRIVLKALRK